MATDIRNLLSYNSNDADFRAWGSGIAAQLAAVGLVQTADTGQINWTTVARPGAGTDAGYEIWRFNDSLQATKPVFIKVVYGAAGGDPSKPRLTVTPSTSTNGAGTQTGQVGTVTPLSSNTATTPGSTAPSYCSGDSGRLVLVHNYVQPLSIRTLIVTVERTTNADGTRTGDGIVTFSYSAASNVTFQTIPVSGAIPAQYVANIAMNPATGQVSNVGVDVAISPTLVFCGKTFVASWCVYAGADIGPLTTFTVNHLGAARTLLSIGTNLAFSCMSSSPAPGLAILWE